MNVLFLVGRDPKHPGAGGGDIQAWEWARFLAGRGHYVDYVCLSHPSLAASETCDGVHVHRLGGGIGLPLRAWRFYRRRHGCWDVVHEDPVGGGRLPYLAPWYIREHLSVIWHQVNGELFQHQHIPRVVRWGLAFTEKALARFYRGSLVRAPSQERAEEFNAALGMSYDQITVIPPTVPDEWLRMDPGPANPGPNVLWLGKFRSYKYPHHVVDAIGRVRNEVPAARLILAGRHGERKYETYLGELIAQNGLEDVVEFRFDLSEAEKVELIRSCRALVLPSFLEGFGIVVLEANACGIPVVASSGVPEAAVRHEYNGLRFTFGDVEALAYNIVRILKDDALHDRLSANGLKQVQLHALSKVGLDFEALMLRTAAT